MFLDFLVFILINMFLICLDGKCTMRKMIEWKIHDMKMMENSHTGKAHLENAQAENYRKVTHWKMAETAHTENERMENA